MTTNDTSICDFGLHQGESYQDLPASFLNWMIGNNHEKANIAREELQRREQAATKFNEICE